MVALQLDHARERRGQAQLFRLAAEHALDHRVEHDVGELAAQSPLAEAVDGLVGRDVGGRAPEVLAPGHQHLAGHAQLAARGQHARRQEGLRRQRDLVQAAVHEQEPVARGVAAALQSRPQAQAVDQAQRGRLAVHEAVRAPLELPAVPVDGAQVAAGLGVLLEHRHGQVHALRACAVAQRQRRGQAGDAAAHHRNAKFPACLRHPHPSVRTPPRPGAPPASRATPHPRSTPRPARSRAARPSRPFPATRHPARAMSRCARR